MSGPSAGPNLFCFRPEDKEVVDTLTRAVRRVPLREDMGARDVYRCSQLLLVLNRLPLITEGAGLSLTITRSYDSARYWYGLTVTGERFELEQGESVDGDSGSDNDSRSLLLVTAHERTSARQSDSPLLFARSLAELIDDETSEVSLENFGEDKLGWDNEGDPGWWDELPRIEAN